MRETSALAVLVVEDDPDTAESFRVVLELSGHHVRVAHDGPSALQLVEDFQPDAVFIDLGLPGMNGHDLALRLRSHPACKASVVTAVSGYAEGDDEARERESGFDSHLTKPVDLDAVRRLLDAIVKRA